MANTPSLIVRADKKLVDTALQGQSPVLMWVAPNGEFPTTDVYKALEAAASKYNNQLKVMIADAANYPELKERFEVDSKAVLVGVYNGDTISRRLRPWAADVQGIAESLINLLPKQAAEKADEEEKKTEEKPLNNKPVHVTDATFEQEVLESDLPVLVDFWAEWCGPCRMVAPILDKLAGEYAGKVKITKVDVDSNPGLQNAFRIQSIPTLMCVKDGKIVFSQPGALPEPVLRDLLNQLVALKVPA